MVNRGINTNFSESCCCLCSWQVESRQQISQWEVCLKVWEGKEWKENSRWLLATVHINISNIIMRHACINKLCLRSNSHLSMKSTTSLLSGLHGGGWPSVYPDKSSVTGNTGQESFLIWRMYKQQLHHDDYYNTVAAVLSISLHSVCRQ